MVNHQSIACVIYRIMCGSVNTLRRIYRELRTLTDVHWEILSRVPYTQTIYGVVSCLNTEIVNPFIYLVIFFITTKFVSLSKDFPFMHYSLWGRSVSMTAFGYLHTLFMLLYRRSKGFFIFKSRKTLLLSKMQRISVFSY